MKRIIENESRVCFVSLSRNEAFARTAAAAFAALLHDCRTSNAQSSDDSRESLISGFIASVVEIRHATNL